MDTLLPGQSDEFNTPNGIGRKGFPGLIVGTDLRSIEDCIIPHIKMVPPQDTWKRADAGITGIIDGMVFDAISSSDPIPNVGYGLVWVDGEVINIDLVETLIKLHRQNPQRKLIWSLGAETNNRKFVDKLSEKIRWVNKSLGIRDVEVFRFSIDGNTHLDPKAVAEFKKKRIEE